MKKALLLVLFLGVVSAISGLCVGYVNSITEPIIAEKLIAAEKENLEKMIAGENGACKGKLAIAKKAKALGYDAIRDSVHEMCKDEARHGKALVALVERYLSK